MSADGVPLFFQKIVKFFIRHIIPASCKFHDLIRTVCRYSQSRSAEIYKNTKFRQLFMRNKADLFCRSDLYSDTFICYIFLIKCITLILLCQLMNFLPRRHKGTKFHEDVMHTCFSDFLSSPAKLTK